jgi:hypothetical protein
VNVLAYGLDWHARGSSAAFHDLLVKPLATYMDVQLAPISTMSHSISLDHVTVFCQVLPPVDQITNRSKLVWIPMWDTIRYYPQRWWNKLPKCIKIVAFSSAVANRASKAGLQVLKLSYYNDPKRFPAATWNQGRTLLYWNRTGLIGPDFLERLCSHLLVDTLIYRNHLDPGIPATAEFVLPAQLGRTKVETITGSMTRDTYWDLLRRANIYIAPRLYEGAGMTFLEALASGCAVLAHNGPTMNEYIRHGTDGYLLHRSLTVIRIKRIIQDKLSSRGIARPISFAFSIPPSQNWTEIEGLNIEALGYAARQQHKSGFEQWQVQIPEYAHFISDW